MNHNLQSVAVLLGFSVVHRVHVHVHARSPHQFRYLRGAYAVNEHFQRTNGALTALATADNVVIHHYVLKSWQVTRERLSPFPRRGR